MARPSAPASCAARRLSGRSSLGCWVLRFSCVSYFVSTGRWKDTRSHTCRSNHARPGARGRCVLGLRATSSVLSWIAGGAPSLVDRSAAVNSRCMLPCSLDDPIAGRRATPPSLAAELHSAAQERLLSELQALVGKHLRRRGAQVVGLVDLVGPALGRVPHVQAVLRRREEALVRVHVPCERRRRRLRNERGSGLPTHGAD